MSNYVSFYTSQDFPVQTDATPTWSVYTEQYVHADDDEPIDGSQMLIESDFPTAQEADERARELWRTIKQDTPS